MHTKLIDKGEIDKLLRTMTNPRAVCQRCGGRVDCIGIDLCYPASDYLVIEYKIREPTQTEIGRLVNS